MILKHYAHLFLAVALAVVSSGCGKQRKAKAVLKKSKTFIGYAQERYAQEIALLGNVQGNIGEDAKERYTKKIKEIAMNKHAQSTPLYYYQLECVVDANKANNLMNRLQHVSSSVVETEGKKLLECIAPIDHTLKIVNDLIRIDLDFLHDRQAYVAHANAGLMVAQLSSISMRLW